MTIRAKVAIVGAPSVGKTSLIRQFVHSIFSEEYHSTLGVKVDRKQVQLHGAQVTMLLWDMHGPTDDLALPAHYLRGVGGALAVFDSTRIVTASIARELQHRVEAESPAISSILLLANKSDLDPDWSAVSHAVTDLGATELFRTSAKTGSGVDDAFTMLAKDIWARSTGQPPQR